VRQGKERRLHRESNLANTEAWNVARGRLTSVGVSAQKGGGAGTVRAKKRSAGGVGLFTEGRRPFIGRRRGGEAGCLQWPVFKELQ
jgi:hypothetical protein